MPESILFYQFAKSFEFSPFDPSVISNAVVETVRVMVLTIQFVFVKDDIRMFEMKITV